jgi:hypothetical protein
MKCIFTLALLAGWLDCHYVYAQMFGPVSTNASITGIGIIAQTTNKVATLEDLRDYEMHSANWRDDQLASIARGYVYQTNFLKAKEVFIKLLASQPTNVVAIRGLGNCYWLTKITIQRSRNSNEAGN